LFCGTGGFLAKENFSQDFFIDNSREKRGFHWIYIYETGMEIPDKLYVIDFEGVFLH